MSMRLHMNAGRERERDMPVTTDDFVSISDFFGRYCWLVDDGDEDGWVSLWAEDGVFAGATPQPVVGREALKSVPRGVMANNQGRLRHLIGSLHCDYSGRDSDKVQARYYNFVTNWKAGGAMTCLAISTVRLRRDGSSWLIERNDCVTLV